MIIDTHSQLFTKEFMEFVKKGELKGLDTMGYALFFKGDIKDTILDMEEAGVDKSVVVAIDAETTKGYKISNEIVAEAVKKYPDKLIGFASVDPHKGKLALNELEYSIKELGLKGLKLIPHLIEVFPNDKIMYPIYEKAKELKIPILFHTGTHFHLGCKIKYNKPEFIDEIAVDFPEVNFIIAHFGYPWFYSALAVVQKNFNVYFNIAGWSPKYIPEPVIKQMDSILSNKVLFGSDHPLLSRKRILTELKELNLKEATKSKLFEENAKQILNLKTKS